MQADLKAGRDDHYFASSIIPAVFYRESCHTKVYASAFNTCPSASNCTWDEFATLGLCYRIAELSEAAWQTDCEAGDDSGCSYDIRGITQFEIEANFVFRVQGGAAYRLAAVVQYQQPYIDAHIHEKTQS